MWEPVEQSEDGKGEILYRATLYEYDSESNKVREKRGLDKVGARQIPKRIHELRFGYDTLNRLISVEDSHGANMGGVGEINLLFELFSPRPSIWFPNWKK